MPQYRGGRYRGGRRRIATGGIVGIAIAGFVVLLFALLCLYYLRARKLRANRKRLASHDGTAQWPPPPRRRGGLLGRLMPGRSQQQEHYADMEQAGYGQRPHQGYDWGYGHQVNSGVDGPSYGPGYHQTGRHSVDYESGQVGGVRSPPPAYGSQH